MKVQSALDLELRHLLRWNVILGAFILALAFAPWIRCPSCEGHERSGHYREVVRLSRLPGVSNEQADMMLAWAESFPCGTCGRWKRLSVFAYARECPVLWRLPSQR